MLRSPFMWGALLLVAIVLGMAAMDAPGWPLIFPALALLLVFSMHLRTQIQDGELRVGLLPVWRRRQPLSAVRSARVIRYEWIKFGGWGIRLGDGAVAYTCWEKDAVRLELDGRDLVVGTGRPDELLAALAAQGVTVHTEHS